MVTTITTEKGTMTQKTQSYSTAKTEGTSSSNADTVMWNDWQETSRTVPDSLESIRVLDPQFNGLRPRAVQGNYFGLKVTGATLGLAGAVGGAFCVATAGIGCAILAGAAIVGSGIALTAELLDQMDDMQDQAKANRCDPDAPYVLPKCIEKFTSTQTDAGPSPDEQTQTVQTQDLAKGGTGTQYSNGSSGQVQVRPQIQISYPPNVRQQQIQQVIPKVAHIRPLLLNTKNRPSLTEKPSPPAKTGARPRQSIPPTQPTSGSPTRCGTRARSMPGRSQI